MTEHLELRRERFRHIAVVVHHKHAQLRTVPTSAVVTRGASAAFTPASAEGKRLHELSRPRPAA